MRGLTKRWVGCEAAELAAGGDLVERVLVARGLVDAEARAVFLEPKLTGLHDPSLIPNLDLAAERLLGAARSDEKIVVYGDYDADGVTASAILVRAVRMLVPGAEIEAYLPHRLEEGYGLNGEALREIAAGGARVVVTVDCGVTAVAEAELARGLGLELFITDHHNPPGSMDELPCVPVVHPRHPESAYPFGELCGAGVAFKLAWRMATLDAGGERVPGAVREGLLDLLGLAALGTVADVVPLVDENRAIVSFGLKRLAAGRLVGVRALLAASSVGKNEVDAEAAGFRLGPRLNAAGRLGHAKDALELLLTEDESRAAGLAAGLDALNTKRRSVEGKIVDEAVALAESSGMTGDDVRAIVLANEGWHAGVIGIVCSRLVERFGRPVVLLQNEGGVCKGSCRSIDGFNICEALRACGDHLLTFGGHDMAAGLSLSSDCFDAFRGAFVERANASLGVDDLAPAVRVDAVVDERELSVENAKGLAGLAPFGRSNSRPTLWWQRAVLAGDAEPLGAHAKHLQMRLERSGGAAVRVIAWNWGERAGEFRRGDVVDALVRLKLNEWRGRVSAECELVDARIADEPVVEVRSGLLDRRASPRTSSFPS